MKSIIQPFKGRILVIFFLFLSCFVVSSSPLRAQTIPDASFAEAIRAVCPTCIDASNTLTSVAATRTSLDVSARGIADLTGISGFTSLQTLICNSNKITSLPTLPSGLTMLLCDVNQLTLLPTLPSGLTSLSCNYNQLSFLPTLPEGLISFSCNNNQLISLPALPKNLTSLSCSNNLLRALPELPEKLQVLFCFSNQLPQLPGLPESLNTLYCSDNQIYCLPVLPNALSVLHIDANKVTCFLNIVPGLKTYNANGTMIPTPPVCTIISDPNFAAAIRNSCSNCIGVCNNLTPAAETLTELYISGRNISNLSGIEAFKSLRTLNCDGNKLTSLPGNLPATLTTLNCNNNQLTALPALPNSLTTLSCYRNQLTNLSNLPSSLLTLNCSSNQLTAIDDLPNSITNLDCNTNQLTSLPSLPSGLKYLNCYKNKLTSLPLLPNTLADLYSSDNQLSSLPVLPNSLRVINVDNNLLTNLPGLPSNLTQLSCRNNLLQCLPILPNSLYSLYIDGTNTIRCIPNVVKNLYISNTPNGTLPLCGVADANFARAIRSACPSCMDECYKLLPEAASVTSLDISDKNLTSLAGIEAFTSLQSLNCSKNQLACLPPLPKSLTSLTIDADKITCLPGDYPDLKVYNASGQLISTPGMCTFSIPDINFANAIRSTCSTCIDECNNLLPPAAMLTYLSISNRNISDLTGIEGFITLQTLYCSSNKLTTLPKLPATLTTLECNSNLLTALSNLPPALTYLNCANNAISSISDLPPALTYLNCANNAISSISDLPAALTSLICYSNKIVTISNLPSKLTTLECNSNLLTALSNLPLSLTNLQCSYNKIADLAALPDNLTQLNCSNNLLTVLPSLPSKLTRLYCENNKLTALPELPATLNELYCSNNQLACLPFLPGSLRYLSIYNNVNVKCLPNSVSGLSVNSNLSNPIPICGVADINFARAIRSVCPSCMDECYKLTPEAASVTSLDLSDKNITNLAGIETFTSLQSLNCSKNQLSCLPPFPKSLTSLTIDADKITCLPGDYPDLKVYNASGQFIPTPGRCLSFIPDVNFANAIRSSCSNCIDPCNNLLPPAATLTYLYISNRGISDLTGIEGFKSLQTLYCDNNKLTTLPQLPAALTYLSCSYNQLSQLPELPVSLRNLYCHYNRITCLPPLPLSLSQIQLDVDKIFCIPAYNSLQSIINQNGNTVVNFPVCSNPIVLSEITASANNPIAFGGSVTFRIQRNLTGAVSVKWQRKKANEADFMDITTATIVYNLNNDMTYTASNVALTDDGNSYRVVISSPCIGSFISKSATIEVRNITFDTPIVTSSPKDTVCVGQTVRLSAACPSETTVEWNTGATGPTIDVKSVSPLSRSYTAKCVLGSNKTDSSPAKVIVWKPLEVTLINIGQSQSGIKPGVSVPMSAWNNQFVTPDAGPDLHTSTQANPTIYYIENANKTTPRYWTAHVDACDLPSTGSISYDMLATPEVGAPMSFNTHENSAPYLMYANRDGFTELYAQNNVFFGFYEKDHTGQNRYDAGLPKGLYKLSIRYWNQKGNGLAPAVRVPQGSQLSYQEHWFRIQSQAGVGNGAARTAFNNDQLSDRRTVVNNDQWAEVSPNPVTKILRLNVNDAKGKSVNVSLVDAWGRTLLQRIFVPETNRHQEEFEVSDKAAGMYLMRVNSSTKQAVLKVIKTE